MIGPLEIVILVLIILVVFGGYRALPAIGRSAGTGLRKGGEKAKELAGRASERAEKVDTDRIARSAGEGLREARELRDSVTGKGEEPEQPGSEEPEDGRR